MASAPVFRKPLHDLSTTQGECLVLECRVSGTPLPDIIWRREGHVITDSPDFRMLHKGNYCFEAAKQLSIATER